MSSILKFSTLHFTFISGCIVDLKLFKIEFRVVHILYHASEPHQRPVW